MCMESANVATPIEIVPPTEADSSHRVIQILAAITIVAAALYSFHLGKDSLGASEAYSAWAASKPSVAAIVRTPVMDDPGKQVFYYVVLHYFARIFGLSEIALRTMSVAFALASVALIFAVGREMFDSQTGVAAAAIWA